MSITTFTALIAAGSQESFEHPAHPDLDLFVQSSPGKVRIEVLSAAQWALHESGQPYESCEYPAADQHDLSTDEGDLIVDGDMVHVVVSAPDDESVAVTVQFSEATTDDDDDEDDEDDGDEDDEDEDDEDDDGGDDTKH